MNARALGGNYSVMRAPFTGNEKQSVHFDMSQRVRGGFSLVC